MVLSRNDEIRNMNFREFIFEYREALERMAKAGWFKESKLEMLEALGLETGRR